MDALARQKFNTMMSGMASLYGGHWNGHDKFSIDPIKPVLEQTLEKRIQEKSELLSKINIRAVRDKQGEKLGLSSGARVASRTNTDNEDRKTKSIRDMDGREFKLYKTDFDTHITYAEVDEFSAYPDFETMYRDKITEQIANDRVVIGWHGEKAEADTDMDANPMLQDVNRGWLQAIREDKSSQLMGTAASKVKIGEDGTYATLDAAIFDIRHKLLDPWNRNRNDLVVILGSDLYHTYHLQMISDNLAATERNAREQWIAKNTIAGLPVRQEEFFPERGVLITTYKNLSIYYQRGRRRRTIVDNAKRDRVEDYQSTNEGYIVEDYGLVCGIDGNHLLLPDGSGGWA